ncbi:MAG: LuxR C-terminal-related transcriptional regulator [Cyanobacteria bacterium J06648_16]
MTGFLTSESACSKKTLQCKQLHQNGSLMNKVSSASIDKQLVSDLIDGILIVTDDRKLIYANAGGMRLLQRLSAVQPKQKVPLEIWHICESLIKSRHLFPDQHWLIQSDIFIENLAALHVQAKWLSTEQIDQPCLLLLLEDRQHTIHSIAAQEAEQYGLTPREKEVWLLHRSHRTYKQISSELGITANTVKKHMKSIHSKRKERLGGACAY